jgi:sugar lactone lactonase YvrE
LNGAPPVILPDGPFLGSGELLVSSVLWIAALAFVATLIGWPIGVAVSNQLRRGRGRLSLFLLAMPLCLPAYLAFWSMWRFADPNTWFGAWLMRSDAAVIAREAALVAGLTLWAAPLAAWCIVASRSARNEPTGMLRQIDGPSWRRDLVAAWHHDRRPLVQGCAVAALGLLGESVSFDLAQVRTYGFELRSLDLSGAGAAAVMAAAWPSVLLTGVLLALAVGSSRRRGECHATAERDASSSGPTVAPPRVRSLVGYLLLALVVVPPASIILRVGGWREVVHEWSQFVSLHSRPTLTSLALAGTVGSLLGIGALGCRMWSESDRPVARLLGRGVAAATLLLACIPATVLAIAHEALWNNQVFGAWVYDTPLILILALLTRLGVVAILASALVARRPMVDRLVAIDRPQRLGTWWRIRRPEWTAVAIVAAVVGASLTLSEVALSGRLVPPRMQLLATSVLNAIHYQQPETVMIASGGALALGALAAAAIVWGRTGVSFRQRSPRSLPAGARAMPAVGILVVLQGVLPGVLTGFLPVFLLVFLLGFLPVFLPGCTREGVQAPVAPAPPGGLDANGQPEPVPCIATFGTSGYGPGQFRTPRGVAYDPRSDCYYIVDKEARIQRFDRDGQHLRSWKMPDSKVGKPVGLSVHPDGRLFVADTHYQRVLVFDQDGNELARFGSFGKELGQFIYPTDIAFGNDGRIYVGEYGGNDRIQIFSPTFEPLGAFGSAGIEDGQLSRPQGLTFDAARNELYVADSNNHRVVMYSPDGERLRQFGVAGTAVGQLSYPRGVVLCGDGSIMVVEFGNHRVQRFAAAPGPEFGKSLGIWGGLSNARSPARALGRGVSEGDQAAADESLGLSAPRSGAPLLLSDGGTALDVGRLQYPWDMAGLPGHVFILDSGHDRVMIARLPS